MIPSISDMLQSPAAFLTGSVTGPKHPVQQAGPSAKRFCGERMQRERGCLAGPHAGLVAATRPLAQAAVTEVWESKILSDHLTAETLTCLRKRGVRGGQAGWPHSSGGQRAVGSAGHGGQWDGGLGGCGVGGGVEGCVWLQQASPAAGDCWGDGGHGATCGVCGFLHSPSVWPPANQAGEGAAPLLHSSAIWSVPPTHCGGSVPAHSPLRVIQLSWQNTQWVVARLGTGAEVALIHRNPPCYPNNEQANIHAFWGGRVEEQTGGVCWGGMLKVRLDISLLRG